MPADLWDRFAEPPRAFSPVPLWWWSGDTVTAERLRWQLERLAAGGVFNVVVMNVAPTSPLYGKDADDPPFMSEAWWALFEGVCRDAEELGVSLWFYDQIGFSGANFQGQVVRAHPEHAGRWLEREVVEGEGELTVECPAGGTPIGAAALTPAASSCRSRSTAARALRRPRPADALLHRRARLRLLLARRRASACSTWSTAASRRASGIASAR